MKLKKMVLHEAQSVMNNAEMKTVKGGTPSTSCSTCLCYDANKKELGNLGEQKNATYCWDACVSKFGDNFEGHICQ